MEDAVTRRPGVCYCRFAQKHTDTQIMTMLSPLSVLGLPRTSLFFSVPQPHCVLPLPQCSARGSVEAPSQHCGAPVGHLAPRGPPRDQPGARGRGWRSATDHRRQLATHLRAQQRVSPCVLLFFVCLLRKLPADYSMI